MSENSGGTIESEKIDNTKKITDIEKIPKIKEGADISSVGGVKSAAAIKRDDNDAQGSAKIIAKGRGKLAEDIVKNALLNDIPIKEDPDLMMALSKLDLYQDIPEDLYTIISSLISELYLINNKLK